MNKKNLYSLPKDLLVELIYKIQEQTEDRLNPDNFTSEQCNEYFKKLKSRRQKLVIEDVQAYLLKNSNLTEFQDLIMNITKITPIDQTRCKMRLYEITFEVSFHYGYCDFHDALTCYQEHKPLCIRIKKFCAALYNHDLLLNIRSQYY